MAYVQQARSPREHHARSPAAKMPGVEPTENVWQFLRDNWLSNRIFKSYDDIVDAAMPGTNSPTSRGASCPSDCAIGPMGVSQRRLVLFSFVEYKSWCVVLTVSMAWSPTWRFNPGDTGLNTPEATPPSINTNPTTGLDAFMSGIAAVISFDDKPIERGVIEKMTAVMSYRGPDGINHWVRGPVALGQCMLRTTPESLEDTQPLCNEDESVVLVMDGWLSNWEELRAELRARGVRLRTRSDTELVLRAYECWERDCPHHLDGEFAFVIWDQRRREAFCARDHTGCKPFHYHWNGRTLIVASDLNAILSVPFVSQEPNSGMIAEILANEMYTRDETVWLGVMRLVAACRMNVDGDGPRIEQYWRPPLEVGLVYKREEEYFEHYRELFADCVRRTSRSHKRVAYQVSGGLDSSAVFSMAENLRKAGRLPAPAIKGYTFVFDASTDADEIVYARAVGEHLGLKIREVAPFKPNLSWFDECVRKERDLPLYPNTAMSVSLGEAMASDDCRVTLNGEGGDEWLGGKRFYYGEELAARQWAAVYNSLREDAAAVGLRQSITWLVRYGLVHFLPRPIKDVLRKLVAAQGTNYFNDPFWLSHEMQKTHKERSARFDRNYYLSVRNLPRRAMLMSLHEGFMAHAREQFDRREARLGLEARTPMYARKFVEFAFSIPERLRLRGDTRKFVHIKALENLLPPVVACRKTKADFSVAFNWQLDRIERLLVDELPRARGSNLSPEGMARLYERYRVWPVEVKPIWELWGVYACARLVQIGQS
jgi:asparagine synthase (glutamine-hydrolysing)